MIQQPLYIALILLTVVIGANSWAHRFEHSKLMRVLPTPVWCYVPPTILTTCGILPYQSPVYDWISRYVLPACLILLLMTTDMGGLKRIGRTALIAMLGAAVTVICGGIMVFFLFQKELGPEGWKMIGTLTASWVGGTANELAVKEATGLSDMAFGPLFIADITIVYVWMTFLMILSGNQTKIDRLLHANRKSLELIMHHSQKETQTREKAQSITTQSLILCLIIGFGMGCVATWLGTQIPEIGLAINRATWIVILVTTAGLLLAFTSSAQSNGGTATKVGYFLLYFVLASTGAKANLLVIVKAPLFLGIAFIWMLIHGVLYFGFGRLFRMPIAILAAASQAALGGVVSAPIVASTYQRELVSVALILAILGNAVGNYAGILTAQLARVLAGLY